MIICINQTEEILNHLYNIVALKFFSAKTFASIVKSGDCQNGFSNCQCKRCIVNFFGEMVICFASERHSSLFIYYYH